MISEESDDDSVIFISSNLNDASTKFNGWDDNVDLLNKSESDVIAISPAQYYCYNINYDLSNPNDDDVIPISAAEFYGWDDNDDDDELLTAVKSITTPEPYSFGNI
jgi:hypothetical protein